MNLNQNRLQKPEKANQGNGTQGGIRKLKLETEPTGQQQLRPSQVLTRDSRWHIDSRVTAGYARGMDQGYGFIGMGVWISIKNYNFNNLGVWIWGMDLSGPCMDFRKR